MFIPPTKPLRLATPTPASWHNFGYLCCHSASHSPANIPKRQTCNLSLFTFDPTWCVWGTKGAQEGYTTHPKRHLELPNYSFIGWLGVRLAGCTVYSWGRGARGLEMRLQCYLFLHFVQKSVMHPYAKAGGESCMGWGMWGACQYVPAAGILRALKHPRYCAGATKLCRKKWGMIIKRQAAAKLGENNGMHSEERVVAS